MFIKDTANHVFTKDKHPFRCKVGRFPEGSKQEDVQNTTDAMVNGIPGDVQTHVDLEPMENHKCIVPGKRPNAGYIILANNFATSIDALWKVSKDCSTIHTLATLLNELTCYIILENGNRNRKGLSHTQLAIESMSMMPTYIR